MSHIPSLKRKTDKRALERLSYKVLKKINWVGRCTHTQSSIYPPQELQKEKHKWWMLLRWPITEEAKKAIETVKLRARNWLTFMVIGLTLIYSHDGRYLSRPGGLIGTLKRKEYFCQR